MVGLPPTQPTDLPAGRPATPDLPADLGLVAQRVEARIEAFLEEERLRWCALDASLDEPIKALRELVLTGGKRLRPTFCHWGWVAAGGDPDAGTIVDAGAAFEMLQAFALIHDDVMDGSEVRRGAPAVHRRFVAHHQATAGAGEARRFGEGVAILVGDLAFVYADQLLPDGPPGVARIWNELRIELNVGQYLDLIGTATSQRDRAASRRIARYKSGKYTIERPLQLGAALAGGGERLSEPLSRYGDPLGEAFQLRDDVLGAFGDSARTGKPVGDDLREGKPTLLLAVAHENADARQRAVLARVGDPDLDAAGVADLHEVLRATGAVDAVEREIRDLVVQAVSALDALSVDVTVRVALRHLADFVVDRSS